MTTIAEWKKFWYFIKCFDKKNKTLTATKHRKSDVIPGF